MHKLGWFSVSVTFEHRQSHCLSLSPKNKYTQKNTILQPFTQSSVSFFLSSEVKAVLMLSDSMLLLWNKTEHGEKASEGKQVIQRHSPPEWLTMVTMTSCGSRRCFWSTGVIASCRVPLEVITTPTVFPVDTISTLRNTFCLAVLFI